MALNHLVSVFGSSFEVLRLGLMLRLPLPMWLPQSSSGVVGAAAVAEVRVRSKRVEVV